MLFFFSSSWIRSVLTLSEKWFGHWWPSEKNNNNNIMWIQQQQQQTKKNDVFSRVFSCLSAVECRAYHWRHTPVLPFILLVDMCSYWAVIALVLIKQHQISAHSCGCPEMRPTTVTLSSVSHVSLIFWALMLIICERDRIFGIELPLGYLFFFWAQNLWWGCAMCDLSFIADKLSASFFNFW